MPETVSAIVVSFADPTAAHTAIDSLLAQSTVPHEVLVVDNDPDARTAAALVEWGPPESVRVVHQGANLGYTAACNRAAAQADGDWLFFLNPDARAGSSCLSDLLQATDDRTGVVGAQVLLPDDRVNAGDNPLHLTGIAWAGRFGHPREHGPPRRVAAVSGAALLVRRSAFQQLGGMCERFFMYYDDVDLCWRMRLAGWEVVFSPRAVVWHDYEFEKGPGKWYWLERNRLWSVLSNYSAASLALLGPLLLGAQLMVASTAVRDGWARSLLRAWRSLLVGLPALRLWRRQVQMARRVPDSQLLELMSGHFDTDLVESPLARAGNPFIEGYRRWLIGVLRAWHH